jgi:hypothetical protein
VTIDERLEALTHTVELLAQMHLNRDREYQVRFERNEERFQRNEERLAQLMDTMNRLGRIIAIHEQRLDDLENR